MKEVPIPCGATQINEICTIHRVDDECQYWVGPWILYRHPCADYQQFRLVLAQLLNAGTCRQYELVKAFGLNRRMLNRASSQLKERGMDSFFVRQTGRAAPKVLTPENLSRAQELLDQNRSRSEVCEELGIKYDTLRKGISSGRLREGLPEDHRTASTQSERSEEDSKAGEAMGVGCTNTMDRMAAAVGMVDGVPTRFENCYDLPLGGVLLALPAILENGLLSQMDKLGRISGYYTGAQILLVLVMMLLCRIKTVEQLRGHSPGEFGKLIGLDRIPEVRCLRQKMDTLAGDTNARQWSAAISQRWFEQMEHAVGFCYVDGHVKVYGGQSELPRRFVSRQRLCLRGISSYWANDAIGQPLFVVEKQIDAGLIEALESDIFPELLDQMPGQPSEEALEDEQHLHRFTVVFDREGSSPNFIKRAWDEHRIAVLTYRKNSQDQWPESEFLPTEMTTPTGEPMEARIAERGVYWPKQKMWVKEVRKLTQSGHQTAIICSGLQLEAARIAPNMFARWSQENFFGYAMEHFNIDGLIAFGKEDFSGTETLVNPRWREIDKQQRRTRGLLNNARAKYVAMDGQKRADPHHRDYSKWEQSKAELLETIQNYEQKLDTLGAAKKDHDKHITFDQLQQNEKFAKLSTARRALMNTIGMIAYRSETAMAMLMISKNYGITEARSLLQDLFTMTADLKPDHAKGILQISLHCATTPKNNLRLRELADKLNQTETIFPSTNLRIVFQTR